MYFGCAPKQYIKIISFIVVKVNKCLNIYTYICALFCMQVSARCAGQYGDTKKEPQQNDIISLQPFLYGIFKLSVCRREIPAGAEYLLLCRFPRLYK